MVNLYSISENVVEVIPYKSFKEKIRITKEETDKGRRVEVDENNVYSYYKFR